MLSILPRCIPKLTAVKIATLIGAILIGIPLFSFTLRVKKGLVSSALTKTHNISSEIAEPRCYLQRYCIKYLIAPTYVCRADHPKLLFTFILSTTTNFKRREVIRSTWANSLYFRDKDLRIVFILSNMGTFVMGNIWSDLREESRKHNDILVLDFKERYNNLTLKTIGGVHLAAHFCPDVTYVFKTDDDVHVNMFILLERLARMARRNSTEDVLMGDLRKHVMVEREGHFAISKEAYEPAYFPSYIFGLGYIMSSDVVRKLNRETMRDNRTIMMRFEDAFMSGVMAERAGVTPYFMHGALFWYPGYEFKNITRDNWRRQTMWHGRMFTAEDNFKIWNALVTFSNASTPFKPEDLIES